MITKILVVEDEEAIRGFIKVNLRREGLEVIEAASGEEALLKSARENDISIAILDVMLPGIDGFEVCRHLRTKYSLMGIIMLTARGQETDKITGLELGADDYVVKPFSPAELMARVRALLRRMHTADDSEIKLQRSSGPFQILIAKRKMLKNNREIELTPKEFAMVELFIKNPGIAFSRDEILDKVWGWEYIGDHKIVDVNVRRIRQKIEENPSQPVYIETVWGYGYRWGKED